MRGIIRIKTLITLTLNPRALAPLTLRSLISSTERPAACFTIARAAGPQPLFDILFGEMGFGEMGRYRYINPIC